ncbi:DUF6119 family protein [Amycolatopsis sp. NPDC051102]|uniref:DUF6119 family protein n=1 Tax=Amycolatopsis sp. NPDC051102 TaxID=3155163 RepID=UPI003433C851
MTEHPIGEDEPNSFPTRKMSLYRMYPADSLQELAALKILEDTAERFTHHEVRVGSTPGLLISGESPAEVVDWVPAITSLTGVNLGFTSTTASAALFLKIDDVHYALTFGHGWRYLRDSKLDREFGLEAAVRLLDPDEIRRITRWALSAKARVDQNMVPGGQGLWAFGLREHAELVRKLSGKVHGDITVDLAYVRQCGSYRNFRLNLECGDGVQLPLGIQGESLISDLRELTQVVAQLKVRDRLEPLQWVRRLAPGHDLHDLLDSTAVDLLAQPDSDRGEVGIAYPAKYYDGPDVRVYRGHVGSVQIDTDDLGIDDLRMGIASRTAVDQLRTLRASTIEGLDETGKSLGGSVSALHWMAAEIIDPKCRYILLDGDWYRLGDKYLRHVDRIVTEAFANTPEWTLPAWNMAPRNAKTNSVHERDYNEYVPTADDRFLCLDRKLLRTRIHPQGFETCDLLGPSNVLVHVKKVSSETGSSVLSHLFAQGLVAVESLTDPATWTEFVELVREQDPARAETLGSRPEGLVYAIHRSDKPLLPNTLFTFARSALVSAAISLTSANIPLQVSVIP